MALYRAQVVLMPTSGLLADAATNTWYFDADTAAGRTNMRAALIQFYDDVGTSLSDLIDPATSEIKWYDMADPEPRQPQFLDTLTTITVSNSSFPPEVAMVVSYYSETVSGGNPARHRGRVYLGPLTSNSGERPSNAAVDIFRNAASALLLESSNGGVGTTEFLWMQYSPTNAEAKEVLGGWVDNEFDTQRRRGRIATYRSTYGN